MNPEDWKLGKSKCEALGLSVDKTKFPEWFSEARRIDRSAQSTGVVSPTFDKVSCGYPSIWPAFHWCTGVTELDTPGNTGTSKVVTTLLETPEVLKYCGGRDPISGEPYARSALREKRRVAVFHEELDALTRGVSAYVVTAYDVSLAQEKTTDLCIGPFVSPLESLLTQADGSLSGLKIWNGEPALGGEALVSTEEELELGLLFCGETQRLTHWDTRCEDIASFAPGVLVHAEHDVMGGVSYPMLNGTFDPVSGFQGFSSTFGSKGARCSLREDRVFRTSCPDGSPFAGTAKIPRTCSSSGLCRAVRPADGGITKKAPGLVIYDLPGTTP